MIFGIDKRLMGLCFVLLLFGGPVWGQLANGDPAIRVVGSDQVNVRSEPEVSGDTFVTQVVRGALLKRVDKRDGWYQVQLPDGRLVWIHGRYAEEEVARDLLEVVGGVVNVRSDPSTAAREVSEVKRGDMLSMVRERNGWFYAILPDGKRGWIRNDMVVLRPLAKPKAAVIEPPKPEPEPEPEIEKKEEPVAPQVDYYDQAKDFLIENKVEDALAAFLAATKDKPNDANVHFDFAKLLKQEGQLEDALVHFRWAQKLGRDEAKFFVEEILTSQQEKPAEEDVDVAPVEIEEYQENWLAGVFAMELFLPAIALGAFVFMGILGLLFWRRRRNLRPEKNTVRRRNQDAGFDSALKYAVEKRPLLRAIEEAERKRSELDEALQQRLTAFERDAADGRPRLPAGESSEMLLKKVEDLRKVIVNQEERAQIYSDLIVLQNDKLAALDEEIEALKKLIQIDNQSGAEKPKTDARRVSR